MVKFIIIRYINKYIPPMLLFITNGYELTFIAPFCNKQSEKPPVDWPESRATLPSTLMLKCDRAFSSFSPARHTYFCSTAFSWMTADGETGWPALIMHDEWMIVVGTNYIRGNQFCVPFEIPSNSKVGPEYRLTFHDNLTINHNLPCINRTVRI